MRSRAPARTPTLHPPLLGGAAGAAGSTQYAADPSSVRTHARPMPQIESVPHERVHTFSPVAGLG